MNTKETRIELTNLQFTTDILNYIRQNGRLASLRENKLILSMNWYRRAPDKNDFNCAYVLSSKDVGDRDVLYKEGKFITRPSDQLCIRTMVQGKSTIRFSLIYTDIFDDNSLIKKAFDKMDELIIGKCSPEEIPGITLIDGTRDLANYNLERIAESVSDKENPDQILGRAHLDFDSETTKTEEGKMISIKTDNGVELLKLYINVIRA